MKDWKCGNCGEVQCGHNPYCVRCGGKDKRPVVRRAR